MTTNKPRFASKLIILRVATNCGGESWNIQSDLRQGSHHFEVLLFRISETLCLNPFSFWYKDKIPQETNKIEIVD